jgi:Tfp pilus assembly protein PilX
MRTLTQRSALQSAPSTLVRGAASLIVVMLLFFIMALAGAYSSRNLVFEQRTSANQYRSTQAQEAAEAGVEWALAMLNGGRIGPNCLAASAGATDTSFRQRYLQVGADGQMTPVVNTASGLALPNGALNARCVHDGTRWNCNCPTTGAPSVTAPTGPGPFPAFQVRLSRHAPLLPSPDILSRPGTIMVEVNGCTRMTDECLRFVNGAPQELEGRATSIAMVALKSALPSPPVAALTVRDAVAAKSMTVVNTDPERGGITVQAGGNVDPDMTLKSVPGSPGGGLVANDTLLDSGNASSLQAGIRRQTSDPTPPLNSPNRVFASVFGALEMPYRQQPAAIVLDACAGNCRQTLTDLVARNPGRVIWVQGDVNLGTDGQIGSAAEPAVIVATGSLVTTAANAAVIGFVYTQGGAWTGSPSIRGAAFVENALAATAGGSIIFDRAVIETVQLRSGSFVRVPGGWRDFQ